MKLTAKAEQTLIHFLDIQCEANAQKGWEILAKIAELNMALKMAAAQCEASDRRAFGVLASAGMDPSQITPPEMGRSFTSIQKDLDSALADYGMDSEEWDPSTFFPMS